MHKRIGRKYQPSALKIKQAAITLSGFWCFVDLYRIVILIMKLRY